MSSNALENEIKLQFFDLSYSPTIPGQKLKKLLFVISTHLTSMRAMLGGIQMREVEVSTVQQVLNSSEIKQVASPLTTIFSK